VTAVPGGPATHAGRVPVSVAFCPAPPLLLPAVEGKAAAETTELRRACAAAVAEMLAGRPETVAVVGEGLGPGTRVRAGDVGSLHGFGLHLDVPFAGPPRSEGSAVPLPHSLGAWLLDAAGFGGERVGVGPSDLAALVRDAPARLGILAMGDGSARRTLKAPGYLDDDAGPFDATVARVMAAGDAAALAALDPDRGARLLAAGVPTWRAVGEALAGREVTARLHYDAAPFGVGYLVADWVAP